MNDMKKIIEPRSDQLNADDLISGPITIKITGVSIKGGQEQPVAISFEGDNGKPYKACKSMCRVMVTAWGADSKQYVGRSMTLYRDPSVKWGGMEVGGIRISHMSHIDSAITLALTMTRANKKPFTVRPLKTSAAQGSGAVTPSSDLPDPAAAGPESAASQDIVAGSAPVKEAAPTGKPTENAADFQDSGSIYITVDQALHLSELCKDYGVDEVKVCRTFSASKISLISAVNYKRAFDYIEKARK